MNTYFHSVLSWPRIATIVFILSLSQVGLAQEAQPDTTPRVTATLRTDRLQRFQGERFTLTLTIVARNTQLGNQFNLSRLPPEGALVLGSFRELPTRQNRIDGVIEEIKQFRCEADAAGIGRIQLAPVLHYEIKKREKFLLGSAWVTSSRRTSVIPLNLEFQGLPTVGKPASYSGAIGTFAFDVTVNPRQITVGELITVGMKIKGQGRFDGITSPSVQTHSNLKTYPPKIIASSKDFLDIEQTVIPQSTNLTAVPEVAFTYFDPGAGKYKTIRRGHFPLQYVADQSVVDHTPYRPTVTGPVKETRAARPLNLVGTTRADHYRTATFIITVLASLLALGGVVNIAMGKRTWKQGRILLTVAAIGGLAAAWTRYSGLQLVPDHVLRTAATVRIAPAHSAMRSFDLPVGSVIKVREQWEHWIRVETDGKSGWVPADMVKSPSDST